MGSIIDAGYAAWDEEIEREKEERRKHISTTPVKGNKENGNKAMTEDYKKRYEEALERARDMLSYKEVRQEDMEYLFPELKEDEGEIVKRTLILKFKEWKLSGDEDETWYGLSYDSVIAWLEKQGAKPQGKSIIEAWKDMRFEVYQQASGNRHEPNYSDDNTKMFSLNDIDEIIEKINENY